MWDSRRLSRGLEMRIFRSMSSLLLCLCVCVVASLGVFVHQAQAQVLYGSLVGTVTDQTEAVVPGAQVTITSTGTGLTRETTTDEGGRYSFVNVLAGTYEAKITASGFRPVTRTAVEVTINTVTRVDVKLEVGAITEQVTVAAAATQLQTDKSDTRAEITARAVTNLPLGNYRNYQTLINLVPGATPAAFQNAVVDTPGRSLTTNINGTNRNNNNTRVDGATNVFIWLPHHTLYNPPVESLEAVNVSTSSFDAEQGMAGGAAITVATKSGTNEFHGSAFWYHDNQHLRARNFFNTGAYQRTPQKPKSINNIAGGTFGGPIAKNKLFFFGSYERTMERTGQQGTFDLPNMDIRDGNFSAYSATIYDPATGNTDGSGRQPFAGNKIPLDRQSSIFRTIQSYAPDPNIVRANSLQNFFNAATQKLDRDQYDVKVNYNPVTQLAVWGKYSRMDAPVNGVPAFGTELGGPALGTRGTGDTTVNIVTFGGSYTASPTLLVDGVFAYDRFDQTVFGPDFGTNYGTEVWGIPGTNQGRPDIEDPERYSGQPAISHGFTAWGNTDGWMPLWRNDRSYKADTNVTKISGSHEIRFGFGVVRFHMDHWQPEVNNPRGSVTFAADATALRGGAAPNYLNQYAAALLGLVSNYGKSEQFDLMTNREWQFGWYVRDNWKVTRKLTLNLGLRYEYFPLITRIDRGIERWDPATNIVTLGGVGNIPSNNGITTSKKLFGPRIGFAYRMTENTVIRSGYGITYDPLPFSRPLRGLYPLSIAASYDRPASYQWYNTVYKGIPAITPPDASTGSLVLPPTVDMGPRSAWAGELHRGYIQSWNFTVERRMPWDLVTSVAYVGNQTVHQMADININATGPGESANPPLKATQGRLITANMWNGYISANYHALQVAVNRQFSRGLLLKGAYTWSKAINLTDDDGWAGVGRNWLPAFRWNRAPAGYDRRHMFVMAAVYQLPFGKGQKYATEGVGAAIAGGWQVSTNLYSYTGTPFTVVASGTSLNSRGNTQTADQVKTEVVKIGDIGPGTQFRDATAFRSVTQVRFGTAGRNILRGPGMVGADLMISREFRFTEQLRMEFKAEAFNFTNTPHFSNPGTTNVSSASFNPDGTIKSLGNFLSVTSAQGAISLYGERQWRFGLRLSF